MGLFDSKKKKEEEQEQLDDQTKQVVSAYLPRRRLRLLGSAFLRQNRLKILIALGIFLVILLFVFAFLQEKAGNFTINLDRLELFRKGISMSADAEFTNPTARLVATSIEEATNISGDDIPENVNDIDGDHNGRNYLAYTYYIRNAGKEDVAYKATMVITSASKGVEKAARIAIWRNNEKIVYAEPASDGKPEPGTTSFIDDKLVCEYTCDFFGRGFVDKYTVVIWLEGDDPECVDAIVGGALEFSMDIQADEINESSLLKKYVQDVKDTLTDNDAIGAAGNDSPDFDAASNVNWNTRVNQ